MAKSYSPILSKYANKTGGGSILGTPPKKAATPPKKTGSLPAVTTFKKATPAQPQGAITISEKDRKKTTSEKLTAAATAMKPQNIAKTGLPNLIAASTRQETAIAPVDKKPYYPSLGRIGIRPTAQQVEQRQLQNIADVSNSAFVRANVGAFQGAMPVNVKVDPRVQEVLDKSLAYQASKVGGTIASFAVPYLGAGGSVMKGAAKIAPRLLPAAEGIVAKGVQRVLPKLGQEAAEKIGKGVVKDAVTGAVIGTPLNINQAVNKDDLRGRKAVQNVAINAALDLISGGVLEAAPYILKSGKRVLNSTNFKQLKPDEQTEVVQGLIEQKQLALPAPTDQSATLYGTSQGLSGKLPSSESQAFEQWRKENFGGAFGKMSPEDTRAMQDLYIESKTPDYSSAVGRTETPRTIRPGEMSTPVTQRIPEPQKAPSQLESVAKGTKTPSVPSASLKMDDLYASKTVDVPKTKTDAKLPGGDKVAKVTARSEEIKPSKLEALADITSNVKRKFVDSGDTVSKIAKINNDEGLYHLYNNARNSRQRAEHMIGEGQTNINGEKVGESLRNIFDPIRKKGDEYYNKFQEYMYHLHNVDRMAQEKPVFGESVTAESSAKSAQELLAQNPEFKQYQDDIRKYIDNLMNYRKDSGLVSQESADIMADMYKNYVPTFRKQVKSKGIEGAGRAINIGKTIKKASGGNEDLLPLHEQLSKQTMQTVDAANKNLFGQRLLANANEKTAKYLQELKPIVNDIDIDADASLAPELKNAFNIYTNGQGMQLKVDKGLYEGIQALGAKEPNELVQMASKANQTFKSLITNWNPLFLVRNAGRDIQEVGLTSKDLGEFAKMYPGAIKEIATNGSVWKQYQALGGAGNSFFDYVKGYKDDPSWLKRNTVDRIEALNKGVEQAPRLAEFMATLSKLDHPPTHDDLMKAMYNAADVTTNFGRSGTWGKAINTTAVPFFNPSIQGASKLIRTFTEAKGAREWTSLAAKVAGLGLAPSLLNEMLYHDDKQYRIIDDRIKDTNFVFKIGDNEWIKVPKARILSVFGSTSRRAYDAAKGDKAPFAGYFKTAAEQVGVVNPIEANIAAPLIAVKTNKAWYGGAIDSVRLQSMRPSKRADESTSALSKAIVGAMGKYADKADFSPKKLDYLIDAYSGIIGDVALPLMTSKAEPGTIQKAFTVDTVTQNRIAEDYYNAVDEIKYSKNEKKGIEYDVMNRYLGRVGRDLADKYSQIRDIQSGIGTDKVKAEKVRKIKDSINQQQLQALDQLKTIQQKAKENASKYSDLEKDKALDQLSDEVLGKPASKKKTKIDEAFS